MEVDLDGITLHIHLSIGMTAVRSKDDPNTIVERARQYMELARRTEGISIVTDKNCPKIQQLQEEQGQGNPQDG